MRGWIIDAYPDYSKNSIVLWLWNEKGAKRIEDSSFKPSFFVWAPFSKLLDLKKRIKIVDEIEEINVVERRLNLEEEKRRKVLQIFPKNYEDLKELARIIDSNGNYHDYKLYNVNLHFSQRYFLEKDIFPTCLLKFENGNYTPLEDQFALDYPIPPLKTVLLDIDVEAVMGIPRFQDKLLGARIGEVELDGKEEDILIGLNEVVESLDPDIILTDGGDAFTIPYLACKAEEKGIELRLGRDPQEFRWEKGKSYFTYGKIIYKPPQYLLKGRIHLDRGHFAFRESELAGLIELSRLSTLTIQEQSRLTPGSAITAMQVNQAHKDGCLILWKKNIPENFKSAEDLIINDRGGFIFEPEVGIHENVMELDYSSLYPNIMVRYNISPETILCDCCQEKGRRPPEIRHWVCTQRWGLIPRVLKPIIERKRYYKRRKKESGPLQEIYAARDCILKWLLVTSFGYTGYKNARFGRIECHEAINAYGRELMVRSMEIAEAHGYEVVHGIVDSLWLRAKEGAEDLQRLMDHLSGYAGIPVDLEGVYKWIVFLPCKTTGVGALNRYYGLFQNGEMKIRGIEVRKHDTPEFINQMQDSILLELKKAYNAEEFKERTPKALDIIRRTARELTDEKISLRDLILTKVVTKKLDDYVVLNNTVAALKQMQERGFSVEPGEYIRYVVLDAKSRDFMKKVRVAEFLEGSEKVDKEEYLRYICRAGETLLAPFGYDEARIRKAINMR